MPVTLLIYFNNLKCDVAIIPIPIIPIKAAMPDGIIPKNNKVAEANAMISPAINITILIFLPFFILVKWA